MNCADLIPGSWELPQEVRDEVSGFASRQREVLGQGHLLLVLHQVPDPGVPERRSLVLWRAPDGRWQAAFENAPGEAPTFPDAAQAVHDLLLAYDNRIDQLEARFAEASDAKQLFNVLRETIPVMRATKNMTVPLGVAREHLPKVRELLAWREQAYAAERAVELLYEEARAALDFTIAEEAEVQSQANLEMARAAHRLNTIVALFLPMTAIASAFGMNVASGLENHGPWVFWALIVAGIAVGYAIRAFIARSAIPLNRLLRRERERISLRNRRVGNPDR